MRYILLLLFIPTLVFATDINPKDFTDATTLSGTETLPVYQNGWKKTPISDIRAGMGVSQYSTNSGRTDGETWINTTTQSLVTRIGNALYSFAHTAVETLYAVLGWGTASHNFGSSVAVGSFANYSTTLSNSGVVETGTLTFSNLSSGKFRTYSTATTTIASGANRKVKYQFTPADTNLHTGNLHASAVNGQFDAILTLTGTGLSSYVSDTLMDNTVALATHNANWAFNGTTGNVTCETTGASIAAYSVRYIYYSSSSTDSSQVTLIAGEPGNSSGGVGIRMGSGTKGYTTEFAAPSGGNWTRITVNKNGAFLVNISTTLTTSQASDHTVKITASGTSTTVLTVYIDGSLIGTYSDSSTPITSGSPGIYLHNDANASARVAVKNWTTQ